MASNPLGHVASWPIYWATFALRLPLAVLALSLAAVAAVATAAEYAVTRRVLNPLNDMHRTPKGREEARKHLTFMRVGPAFRDSPTR